MLPVDNAMNMRDVRSNCFHSRNKAFHFSNHGFSSIRCNVDQIGQWNAFIIKILHYMIENIFSTSNFRETFNE